MLWTVIVVILVILIVINLARKSKQNLISNWGTLIDGMKYSTDEFYKTLEESLQANGIENLRIQVTTLSETGMFSSRRKYLRVQWNLLTYDVCFAPFGNGCFASWWLYSTPSSAEVVVTAIPFIGKYLALALFSKTFYQHDTDSMFRSYCQSTMLKVIDELAESQNIKSVPEHERTPMQKSLFK